MRDYRITREDVDKIFGDGFRLHKGFIWGVGNSPYQTEGGFNGKDEPLNNWYEWERSGKAEPTKGATYFYTRYPEDMEISRKIGLTHFRLGVEWARIQPVTRPGDMRIPEIDPEALEHYASMIAHVRNNGMEPVVTLHHFTHPAWIGKDMWLHEDNLDLYEKYVAFTVRKINEILISKFDQEPIGIWETTNEPNIVASASYLLGQFPAGPKRGLNSYFTALTNQLQAHISAYEIIHSIYEEAKWKKPRVTYASVAFFAYWLDKMFFDLLLAKHRGIPLSRIEEYHRWKAEEFHSKINDVDRQKQSRFIAAKALENTLKFVLEKLHGIASFKRLVERTYGSLYDRLVDIIAIDYYDPFLGNYLRLPHIEEIKKLKPSFHVHHWEWTQNPMAFRAFLNAYSEKDGIPIHVFENGICNRVKRGRPIPRSDGWTRTNFLKAYLFELARAVKDGAAVEGYFHWSITDNYEWGSFEPRFGLIGIDYENDAKRLAHDSLGEDAAGTFREIIHALQSGSLDDLRRVFIFGD